MDDPKQRLLTRINECTNVLVTVSNNPSLDQLAGAIGLTLLLNKLGKHATAVFSGEIPSIIEYLKPEETIEKNTDSLRDFIIALDESKADKLRYKVEDKMVKIFITPYRTSISEKDLEFSQGDFNVDLVIALGVHEQQELDQANISHGRILHDATVSSINNVDAGKLGTINWIEPSASSLCELLYGLSIDLKADGLDAQIATAYLTGIVAETKRFGNEKTTAKTLDISSHLMAAGANQQLVAAKLDIPPPPPKEEPKKEEPKPEPKKEPEPPVEPTPETPDKIFKPAPRVKEEPGTLEVKHEEDIIEEEDLEEIRIDEHGVLYRPTDEEPEDKPSQPLITQENKKDEAHPPVLNSSLASSMPSEVQDPSLTPPAEDPVDDKEDIPLPEPQPSEPAEEDTKEQDDQTLSQIEKSVDSPHLEQKPLAEESTPISSPDLEAARDAVVDAINSGVDLAPPPPRVDLNANPAVELHPPVGVSDPVSSVPEAPQVAPSVAEPMGVTPPIVNDNAVVPPLPANPVSPDPGLPADTTAASTPDPLAPPPVPPPMMPPSFGGVPGEDDNKPQDPIAPL